jgi:hypothetical protein
VAVYPSPDGLVLAVDGCYWACPYEIVFFDFANPASLPLPEIDRCEEVTDPVIGWVDLVLGGTCCAGPQVAAAQR